MDNEHPIDWAARTGAGDDVLEEMHRQLRRRRRRLLSLAATAAAAAALIAGLWTGQARRRERPPSEPSTDESALLLTPVRETLADGSMVELRGGARISVLFNAQARRVALVRGEALFTVSKDARRPFLVQAGKVQVRAIGTAFSVSLRPATVEVLVTEGRVAVDRSSDPLPAAPALSAGPRTLMTVDAGNRVVIDVRAKGGSARIAGLVPVTAQEMQSRLEWRVPRLVFSGTPLDEVVRLFNRNSPVRLIVEDPSLDRVHISGVIRADHVDALISLLEDQQALRVERRGGEILLSR